MILVKERAYAKLNLLLKIYGKTEHYHLIDFLNCEIDLFDELSISLERHNSSDNAIELAGDLSELQKHNLIYKAAAFYLDFLKIKGLRLKIDLTKNIPSQAGLGGGSSDGAAVIRVLHNYLAESRQDEEVESYKSRWCAEFLKGLAYEVGADVPYSLFGGLKLVGGIGEKIEEPKGLARLKSLLLNQTVILIRCKSKLETRSVFNAFSCGVATNYDFDGVIQAFYNQLKNPPPELSSTFNDLLDSAASLAPDLANLTEEIKRLYQINPCFWFNMSGSGSTCYLLTQKSNAPDLINKFRDLGYAADLHQLRI